MFDLLLYREDGGSKLLRNISSFYETTRCPSPEDSALLIGCYMFVLKVRIYNKSVLFNDSYVPVPPSGQFFLFVISEINYIISLQNSFPLLFWINLLTRSGPYGRTRAGITDKQKSIK
jgi:hypothetical protein